MRLVLILALLLGGCVVDSGVSDDRYSDRVRWHNCVANNHVADC